MIFKNTTLCLTIGRRPDLLRLTLVSLLRYCEFERIIAINDFRDDATNQVFRELCPHGNLIVMPEQLGHHKAVDLMYSKVETPYVFHCEDDWVFDTKPDIDAAIKLLEERRVVQVCFRSLSDFRPHEFNVNDADFCEFQFVRYVKLGRVHPDWHGFTFNPTLIRLDVVNRTGFFSRFKKEKYISRFMRSKGFFVAYLQPGACHHIGWDESVSHPPQKIRKSLFEKLIDFFSRSIKLASAKKE